MSTRSVETTDYVAFAKRTIRALARRAGEEDEIELGLLMDMEKFIQDCIQDAVTRQRERGIPWSRIALSAGTTRQAVTKRWGSERGRG